jgi:hypothetical protein
MTKVNELLRNLRVASPCHVGWERMSGDDRVRFCDACDLNVYNFSELTAHEVESLVTKTEGRICGRLYRRTDGTIITRDCPIGLRALRKRVARKTTAIFAAILSLCGAAFSQSKNDRKQACKEVQTITLQRDKLAANQSSSFSGVVTDPMGAVLPNAKIVLSRKSPNNNLSLVTDDQGQFTFENLLPGVYKLRIEGSGFKNLEVKKIEIRASESAKATLALSPDGETVVVGIIMVNPDIENSNGTTIIRGDMLRRLPMRD